MNSELENRVLKNLQTHLNRKRDFAGNLGSISIPITSNGSFVTIASRRWRVAAIGGFLEFLSLRNGKCVFNPSSFLTII